MTGWMAAAHAGETASCFPSSIWGRLWTCIDEPHRPHALGQYHAKKQRRTACNNKYTINNKKTTYLLDQDRRCGRLLIGGHLGYLLADLLFSLLSLGLLGSGSFEDFLSLLDGFIYNKRTWHIVVFYMYYIWTLTLELKREIWLSNLNCLIWIRSIWFPWDQMKLAFSISKRTMDYNHGFEFNISVNLQMGQSRV